MAGEVPTMAQPGTKYVSSIFRVEKSLLDKKQRCIPDETKGAFVHKRGEGTENPLLGPQAYCEVHF